MLCVDSKKVHEIQWIEKTKRWCVSDVRGSDTYCDSVLLLDDDRKTYHNTDGSTNTKLFDLVH